MNLYWCRAHTRQGTETRCVEADNEYMAMVYMHDKFPNCHITVPKHKPIVPTSRVAQGMIHSSLNPLETQRRNKRRVRTK